MKKILISLLCLAVLAALYACSNLGNEELNTDGQGSAASGLPFERVSPETLSADLAGKIDQSRADEGYEILTSGSDRFIVVYAGERATAGYSIEIISITADEEKSKVTVRETSPAEGVMVAEVITYPYDVAKLGSGISGNIEIEYVK